jgi:hypothetical protein
MITIFPAPGPAACSDGFDNDGDGLIDFDGGASANGGVPLSLPDPGCFNAASNTENPACQDGLDNDGDGLIDFDGGAAANFGVPIGAPDPQCTQSFRTQEKATSCGLGAELALIAPVISYARRRKKLEPISKFRDAVSSSR